MTPICNFRELAAPIPAFRRAPAKRACYTFAHMAAKKQKKQTSEIGRLTNTVERGFAALAEDIGKLDAKIDKVEERLENRLDKLDAEIDSAETNLAGKLTRVDVKLTKFEESEIDKRMQLEVQVATIEKHLGLHKKIAA